MDPQSLAFTPRDDIWRFQSDLLRLQQTQTEQGERLMRVERRLEDDARMKSVWGTSSPFPGVLSGTPQQGPLQHPPQDDFAGFDDHQSNLIGSLHLDADDEPRRVGATSRANSVRFDESANQGHWSHASRSSMDLIQRTGSGLGGHPMTERSFSYKSDGTAAGHSGHSTTSGRANSLALVTSQGTSHSATSPSERSLIAPGLFVLGSVPSIIRCWLGTDFKHDSLLYAVVCTGSYASLLDRRLVQKLEFQNRVQEDAEGVPKIKLPVYLPEAVPHPSSSRSNSPAPQLPTLTVEFTIVNGSVSQSDSKTIQIVIGSDVLRSRNADILFSSNSVSLFDDERSKLSIPLVRPEDASTFKRLILTDGLDSATTRDGGHRRETGHSEDRVDEAKAQPSASNAAYASDMLSPTNNHDHERAAETNNEPGSTVQPNAERTMTETSDPTSVDRSVSSFASATTSANDTVDGLGSAGAVSRKGSSPGAWSSWRRDSDRGAQKDWANAGKAPPSYQRRDQGIKVLKPVKAPSRSFSAAHPTSTSPSTGQSRFFDEGRRRSTVSKEAGDGHSKRSVSGEARTLAKDKDGQPVVGKSRAANPVGGASAFAWLNAGSSKSHGCHRRSGLTTVTQIEERLLLGTSVWLITLKYGDLCLSWLVNNFEQALGLGISALPPAILPGGSPLPKRASSGRLCRRCPAVTRLRSCWWSCHSSTSGTSVFITASTKKRKLSPLAQSDSQDDVHESAPVHSDELPGLSSPRSSPNPPSVGLRPSASPTRYVPAHLADEVFPAAQDPSVSFKSYHAATASSPSEAYAGLSLENTDSFTDMASSNGGPDGLNSTPDLHKNSPNTDDGSSMAKSHIKSARRPVPRSSSPAKRLASEMEGEGPQSPRDPMDLDTEPASLRSVAQQGAGEVGQRRPLSSAGPNQPADTVMSGDVRGVHNAENSSSSERSDATTLASTVSDATAVSHNSSLAPDSAAKASPRRNDPRMDTVSIPSLDEQVKQVTQLHSQGLQAGQKGFVVSTAWLSRVLARTAEGQKQGTHDKSALEGEIGPVDNSAIISEESRSNNIRTETGEPFVPLKPGLRIGDDFEVFPEEGWNLIMRWYGAADGSPTIVRYAHDTTPEGAIAENIQYELYPPIFTIRKLRDESRGTTFQSLNEANTTAPRYLASRSDLFQDFLRRVKAGAGIALKCKVKLWRVLEEPQTEKDQANQLGKSGILTPATSRSNSPLSPGPQPLLIDMKSFLAMTEGNQREMIDIKDETMNEKYNGHLTMDTVGLAADQTLILEEQVSNTNADEFVSDALRKAADKNGVPISVTKDGKTSLQSQVRLQSNGAGGRASPAPSGIMTRGRARREGRTKGTVGLMNLGNTCYMNSALQCIRSVEELTMYFLQQEYKRDLNTGNPLGYNGAIAKAYAGLLASIYDDSAVSSFAPKNFKVTLGKCQPLFSGYGQQDSQEFLSFLVDGLHEDLNRVIKKPYTENPESDDKTVGDPEAIRALGEKFGENHKARNDSVAMDLFSGFYKNTMVCPLCDKVSITFDPFSLLTLQLPVENVWQHRVVFAPLQGPPILIDVDINKSCTIRNLKEYVAKRIPGLKWNHLMVAEIYSSKFYRTMVDSLVIAEANIQGRDEIVLFELDGVPTNFPPPKKKPNRFRSMLLFNTNDSDDDNTSEFESAIAERMVVPVFHRAPVSNAYSHNKPIVLIPFYVLITREEATDYDAILRKVLARVATLTTKNFLSEDIDEAVPFTSRANSDTVVTTEEDASSNLDPQVQAGSVEGDDSVVEVSMTDNAAGLGGETNSSESQASDEMERDPKPAVLQPGSFIAPEFRALFEMKYLQSDTEVVPTGWTILDPLKEFPTIASRIPYRTARRASGHSHASRRSSSVSDDVDDLPEFSHPQRQQEDAEADSDEGLPPVHNLMRQGIYQDRRANRGKNRKNVTYSKKSKRGAATPVSEGEDHPALIRPCEAIILDWSPQGYNALFEGHARDSMRGMETWRQKEVLSDPEVEEKRAKRNMRKKRGVTLDDCFTETAKGEILSEENAWYCSRCKELRRASKTLEIWKVPDILVIHLKRFSANRGLRDKIDSVVDFPIENLDLSDRVGLSEGKGMTYDLFAVDNHYGGLGGGHYTAFAQNFYDKKWYEYNDSHVSQRNPQSVVTAAAYLLFYRRRSDQPLGPPYLQKLVAEAHQREAGSQASSRDESPAGEGRRLDDFSRNGSSGALAGAGAALLPRGVGSAGASPAKNASENDIDLEAADADADARPMHSFLEDSSDEGLDMTHGASPFTNVKSLGPLRLGFVESPEWDFSTVANEGGRLEDEGLDHASEVAAPGSNSGDDLQERMITDFGEEDSGLHRREGSPMTGSPIEDLPDLIEEDGAVRVEPSVEEADAPVVEVRVGDKDDIKLE